MIITLTGIAPTHRDGCAIDIAVRDLFRLAAILARRKLDPGWLFNPDEDGQIRQHKSGQVAEALRDYATMQTEEWLSDAELDEPHDLIDHLRTGRAQVEALTHFDFSDRSEKLAFSCGVCPDLILDATETRESEQVIVEALADELRWLEHLARFFTGCGGFHIRVLPRVTCRFRRVEDAELMFPGDCDDC